MAEVALNAAPDLPAVDVLVTAAEAYPALERAFLSARSEIVAGFRVFDLKTRLRSPEALAIGQTWFDLVIHTLRRGVAIRIVLSDFDPVARPRLHRATWRTVRMFWAAAELAGPEARLVVVPATHSAVAGIGARLRFWPVVRQLFEPDEVELILLGGPQRPTSYQPVDGCGPDCVGSAYLIPYTDDEWNTYRQKFEVELKHLAEALRAEGYRVHTLVRVGEPVAQIVAAGEKGNYDLLAMATLGRTGWMRV